MNIVRARPPNFEEVAKVFDVIGKPVAFAWGDTIYAPPPNGEVLPHLVAHEAVHGRRQLRYGIEAWWARYLTDAEFRLEEEKLAHIEEYRWLVDHSSGRAGRRRYLSHVAARLSSPLYRYSITKDAARRVLENGYAGNEGRL